MRLSRQHGFGRFITEFYCSFLYDGEALEVFSRSRNIKSIERTGTGLYTINLNTYMINPPFGGYGAGDLIRRPMIWVDVGYPDLGNYYYTLGEKSISLVTYLETVVMGVVNSAYHDKFVNLWGGWPLVSDVKNRYHPR